MFRVERAGCNYKSGNFKVQRNENYPFYTIHILFSGGMLFEIADQKYLLTKEDLFVITAGESHTYSQENSDALGLVWAEISGTLCRELFRIFDETRCFALRGTDSRMLLDMLLDICADLRDGGNTDPYQSSCRIYAMLMELLHMMNQQQLTPGSSLFDEIRRYVDRNLVQHPSVAEIAEHFGISTTYLNRIFHQHTGCSSVQYLQKRSVEYACALLIGTELSCEAVAERSGFRDSGYFYRVFRKQEGMTPSQYRVYINTRTYIAGAEEQEKMDTTNKKF